MVVYNQFTMCPITESAKKALRQNKKRRARNIKKKDNIRGLVKQARALIAEKKTDEAKKLLPQIYQALDKTAKTGAIKKNTANRKKSRITKLLNKS